MIVDDENGYPVLIDPQPSPFHQLVEGKWVISDENLTALLNDQKDELIDVLAKKTDRLKNALLIGYPQAEIDSFY
ncbi:phage tail protein, partial [[Pasteurella] aerogenes]